MASRPEYQAPPEFFYNDEEARKYTQNTRIMEIQATMSERALDLLGVHEYDNEPQFFLDLGCGSGLSGEVIEEMGHYWVGLDIAPAMLDICRERETENGDVILSDIGQGLPFRPGTFDGAISISALQWLCNIDKSGHKPGKRLYRMFSTLHGALRRGAKAVFQFYPENNSQLDLITKQARRAGFFGGTVIDYPESTKAKKYFLVLSTGGGPVAMPRPLTNVEDTSEQESVAFERRERLANARAGKANFKSRKWILDKKARRRRQGKDVREDTKYTGRKRSGRF